MIAQESIGADLLTQGDICARLDISDRTLLRWRRAGRFPHPVDLPGHPRWLRSDIDGFVKNLTRVGRTFFGSHRYMRSA